MKKMNYLIVVFLTILLGCGDDEPTPEFVAPSNLTITSDISTDGSGMVTFKATATNATSFNFNFGDGTTQDSFTGNVTKVYEMGGQNTYTVTVKALGAGGLSVTETIQIDITVDGPENENQEVINLLTSGSSKTWYLAAALPGHLGVGPAREGIDGDWWYPKWYSAQAFEKCGDGASDCFCDDELTFSVDGDNVSYVLDNKGRTFFNAAHKDVVGGTEPEDFCYDFDTSGSKMVTLSAVSGNVPVGETTGTQMDFSDGGFMSYYVGSSTYEILSIDEGMLHVRTYDTMNDDLAWYLRFSSEPATGGGDEKLETIYTDLVWSDEFDVDGAPNPANWGYDLGGGGWGNGESQTYTDDPENVRVEGGMLKITAKGTDAGDGVKHYYDDVTLAATGGAISPVEDFEGTAPAFTGFGGASTMVIDNPYASGENTSVKVAESTKPVGAETWAGTFFDLDTPLDLTTYNSIRVKTWSPVVGDTINLKIENKANADENFEVKLLSTAANEWETLTFDFSAAPAGTYDRVVLFFDFGVSPVGDASFTSARIKSENLYEFTYGRVEIRAKLPSAGGTWPALWALGANFDTVGWPDCGEIDIMEHVGNNANTTSSALHFPGNFGGTAVFGSIPIPTATSEFHNYTVEWTPDSIKFVVDDEFIHTSFVNSIDTPFNADFFFIMNIAMGGTLGGTIDPAFTEDTMEVDYIRVYQ